MFATVVVILPARYEGGQICLDHSGVSKTIDPLKGGDLSTSVVAWYLDALHKTEPITSGCRLALSYNLIHTTPDLALPRLPDMSSGPPGLRRILSDWQQGKYSSDCFPEDSPFFAYVFSEKYSQHDLRGGMSKMRGPDAYMVTHLLPLAQELGFVIQLASLRYTVTGEGCDLDGNYNRKRSRNKVFSSDDEYSEPEADLLEVGEVDETICSLTMVVDAKGRPLVEGFSPCDVEVDALIPEDISDRFESAEREYYGSSGDVGVRFLPVWNKVR